ncbi:uncharacterized protein LOC144607219 [Rhinoraja longicauda]
MSSDRRLVSSASDGSWPSGDGGQVGWPGPQRQMLPTHLLSNGGATTTTTTTTEEEEDSCISTAVPPPLPLCPPVGKVPGGLLTPDIKPKRKFIPDSWKSLWRWRGGRAESPLALASWWPAEEISPPVSPFLTRRGDGPAAEDRGRYEAGPSPPSDRAEKEPETAQSYTERMHVYQLKHAYMKSWPGLLRLLGVMQLLFGAMVFACICAYVQKDSQWYNVLGGSYPAYGIGNNYYYTGPKTPFVLVMAGLAWIVTISLLILGLSLYYRTILLDSGWWPLTEFTINTCIFFVYMAAGIVYVNGFSLGGLCYSMMANSPLYYQLCRVESGQIAATAFLFFNMLLYLLSAAVCLKVWRHELNRREREAFESKRGMAKVVVVRRPFSFKRMSLRTNTPRPPVEGTAKNLSSRPSGAGTLNKSIPAGFIPKPLMVPDYVTKYPKIETAEERERYKGVFNDQYAEYRELHTEIHVANRKFGELRILIEQLPQYVETSEEHRRIMKILEDYKEKKNDPTFVEKKQRCTYLKNKLAYVKQRIQEYDLDWPFRSVAMYGSRPYGSPPAYSPTQYSQPVDSVEYGVRSPAAGSYYMEDKPQHFYKWSSPPGIIRVLEGVVVILCLAIFACVASTLQWQYGYGYGMGFGGGMGGGGGYYPGMGGMGGGGYYPGMGGMGGGGGGYYPGMGGNSRGTTDPRAATGFMIAMAAISFVVVLAFFITSVSKSRRSRTRNFYLLVLVFSAILGGMELIASIVYIMGVNPMAGSSGSMYYSQIRMICSQFSSGGAGMMIGSQYLYHYCVVDPQEAVAIVCGFLAALAFCIIAFLAQRVRQKIWKYGKPNILWDKNFGDEEVGPNVEEWVKTVPAQGNEDAETIQFSDKPANGVNAMSTADYNPRPNKYSLESQTASPYQPSSYPSRNYNSTPSEEVPSKPPAGRKKGKRRRGRPEVDESQYETDYTTGAESCDDMDEEQWERLYPPITSDPTRQEYKREFAASHQEYRQLCAEMNEVNNQINYLNKRLDLVTEDDPSYQGVAEEYNRLKDFKMTSEYRNKRVQSKQLKGKLSYIKRMVSDYDRQRE